MSDTITETIITVDKAAADTIRDMHQQAAAIQQAWQHQSPDLAGKAAQSLARQLGELFSSFFGQNTKIFRDGDLSLFVRTDTIVFGVIYHGNASQIAKAVPTDPDMSYGAKVTGRYCMAGLEASTHRYCAKPYTWRSNVEGGSPTCEGHPPFPVTMPIPGDWSFHS